MGFCDSKTEQKTTIPPPTPEETALLALSNQTMQAYLEQNGFDVTRTEKTWDQTADAQRLAQRRTDLQNRITQLQNRQTTPTSRGGGGFGGGGVSGGFGGNNSELNQLQQQMTDLDRQEQSLREQYKPEVGYNIREKADTATEAIRARYGENSPEYRQAYEQYQQRKITKEQTQADIDQQVLNRTKKLLNGDYGLNSGEQQFMQELLGPMRSAGLNAINYIETAQTTDQGIGKSLEDFGAKIRETGMNMEDALVALENRIQQTGTNMNQALDDEISTTRDLMKMGIEDFTSEQRLRVSEQAASLGRSATDPNFQLDLQKIVQRQIAQSNLELGQYSAQQRQGIAERTGAGLEDAQRMRMGIAERTGQGMEGIAQARVGYAEQAANMRGQIGQQLAGEEANIRSNLAYGLPPQQIGLGMDVGNYQNAIAQQRLMNTQAAYQAPLQLYGTMAQERYAQPTTTTRQSMSPAQLLGSLIGTGVSGYATYAGMRPRTTTPPTVPS